MPRSDTTREDAINQMSPSDRHALALTIAGELDSRAQYGGAAYGTPPNRQEIANILQVIDNRAAAGGMSPEQTVKQRSQFSMWNDPAGVRAAKGLYNLYGPDIERAMRDYYEGTLKPANSRLTNYYASQGASKIPPPRWAGAFDPITQQNQHLFLAPPVDTAALDAAREMQTANARLGPAPPMGAPPTVGGANAVANVFSPPPPAYNPLSSIRPPSPPPPRPSTPLQPLMQMAGPPPSGVPYTAGGMLPPPMIGAGAEAIAGPPPSSPAASAQKPLAMAPIPLPPGQATAPPLGSPPSAMARGPIPMNNVSRETPPPPLASPAMRPPMNLTGQPPPLPPGPPAPPALQSPFPDAAGMPGSPDERLAAIFGPQRGMPSPMTPPSLPGIAPRPVQTAPAIPAPRPIAPPPPIAPLSPPPGSVAMPSGAPPPLAPNAPPPTPMMATASPPSPLASIGPPPSIMGRSPPSPPPPQAPFLDQFSAGPPLMASPSLGPITARPVPTSTMIAFTPNGPLPGPSSQTMPPAFPGSFTPQKPPPMPPQPPPPGAPLTVAPPPMPSMPPPSTPPPATDGVLSSIGSGLKSFGRDAIEKAVKLYSGSGPVERARIAGMSGGPQAFWGALLSGPYGPTDIAHASLVANQLFGNNPMTPTSPMGMPGGAPPGTPGYDPERPTGGAYNPNR